MNDVLEYKGYLAEVHFSAEDDVFYGRLIGINDLVNFEADTVKGLRSAFTETVEDYLQTCKELNKEPDKTYKGSFNIRIPSQLHKEAAMMAAVKKITLNDFVKYAIDFTLSKEKNTLNLKKASAK
jgi:predicted HicB family RNase H-like nuclease